MSDYREQLYTFYAKQEVSPRVGESSNNSLAIDPEAWRIALVQHIILLSEYNIVNQSLENIVPVDVNAVREVTNSKRSSTIKTLNHVSAKFKKLAQERAELVVQTGLALTTLEAFEFVIAHPRPKKMENSKATTAAMKEWKKLFESYLTGMFVSWRLPLGPGDAELVVSELVKTNISRNKTKTLIMNTLLRCPGLPRHFFCSIRKLQCVVANIELERKNRKANAQKNPVIEPISGQESLALYIPTIHEVFRTAISVLYKDLDPRKLNRGLDALWEAINKSDDLST